MLRIATALVLLPLLWFTVHKTSAVIFLCIVLAVVTSALWECYRMLSACDRSQPFSWLGFPAAWVVVAAFSGSLPFEMEFGPEGALVGLTIAARVAAMRFFAGSIRFGPLNCVPETIPSTIYLLRP